MLRRTCWIVLLTLAAVSCGDAEPDYVVAKAPPDCEIRSRLVRVGWPENLEELLLGNCTITHTQTMRGPDFSGWLSSVNAPWMSCDGPVEIPWWVERDAMGNITLVHFCPLACSEMVDRLKQALKSDLVCERDAGQSAGAGSVAIVAPATP